MIQDIQPLEFDNQYRPDAKPLDEDFIFHFQGKKFLCKLEDNTLQLPKVKELKNLKNCIYLFAVKGKKEERYFLARQEETLSLSDFTYQDISVYRQSFPQDKAYAAITAFHLNNWYESEKFCGHCATPLIHDEKERMMRCPNCKNMIYPRINPCVIVGILYDNKILCTQYNRPNAGKFALVAGFCEIGETLEDCIEREVFEEVHLKVKNIRFYKSQPWGQSSSLLAGFLCEAESPDFKVDGLELASAHWYSREELKQCYTPSHIALTSNIITSFMNGKI